MDSITGKILSLSKVGDGYDMLDRVIGNFLPQVFPNIKLEGFFLEQTNMGQDYEQTIQIGTDQVMIDVELGDVEAQIDVSQNDENYIVSTKYDTDDFVKFNFEEDIMIPDVQYEGSIEISKELGIVTHGMYSYNFEVNKDLNY